ncbi:hypothetical protein FBUS_04228 [Fasciolopsis buskii]|uniref:Uncharacterized protein n=1 Tax=Fasciolopsis buskii TaxID=27845 RepID=A0A8E0VPH3_9TREM|nr:hypothetical protein FBUS_04228 [Fasciolopsis buski]
MGRNQLPIPRNNNPYPNTLARSLAEAQIERVRCAAQPLSGVRLRPRSRLLHSLSTQEHTCLELSEPNMCEYCRRASVPLASVSRPPGYPTGPYPLTVNNPAESGAMTDDGDETAPGLVESVEVEQKREIWPLSSDCVFYITTSEDRLIGPFLFTSVPSKSFGLRIQLTIATGTSMTTLSSAGKIE